MLCSCFPKNFDLSDHRTVSHLAPVHFKRALSWIMFTYALSLHYDALTCICWWHGDRIMTIYLWQEQTGGTQSKEAAQGRRTPRLLQPFGIQVVCTTRSAMPGLHVWFECRAAWGPGTEGQPILIFSLSLCPKKRFLQNLQLCWYYLLWMMRYSVFFVVRNIQFCAV